MEQHHPLSADDLAIIRGFAATFLSRFDCYPVQVPPDGHYVSRKRPLTLDVLKQHFRGNETIGAYVLDGHSRAKWVCVDADTDAQWDTLRLISISLITQGLVPYLELSRRGGHLWLFFEELLSGTDARRFIKHILRGRGVDGIEIYPRQDQLRTGTGSLVRLPLGVHQRDEQKRRFLFVTAENELVAPTIWEQARLLSRPQRIPTDFVADVLKSAPEPKVVFPTARPQLMQGAAPTPSEWIKQRVSVLDFVSQYVDLDTDGHGFCPFHDDHRMSFGVDDRGNYWHCFAGCGGGSVIDFWMRWRETSGQDGSFAATVKDLRRLLK